MHISQWKVRVCLKPVDSVPSSHPLAEHVRVDWVTAHPSLGRWLIMRAALPRMGQATLTD